MTWGKAKEAHAGTAQGGNSAQWRQDADIAGWKWIDPNRDRRVSTESPLALAIEALRHGIDLRDASAESGEEEGLTARSLILLSILNQLFDIIVQERAFSLGLTIEVPRGTGSEIAQKLMDLAPEEWSALPR